MVKKIKVAVIIVAGGTGQRMGGGVPKQYLTLGGKAVLRHTAETFLAHCQVDAVQVVIGTGHEAYYRQAMEGLTLLPPVQGGETRQQSVRKGLEALEKLQPDLVLIHDAARPNVSTEIINRVLKKLQTEEAVIPVVPLTDSLKKIDEDGNIRTTIPRKDVVRAQTPQGFHYRTLLALYRTVSYADFRDDARLFEVNGKKVCTVAGDVDNLKLTTPEDHLKLEVYMGMNSEIRTGMGFDVHPFEAGDAVVLCGVKVPHSHKLKGHSDADAGLHALTDALLGAIGAGDIGQHFPPSDPKWKNADSGKFVEHAVKLIEEKGGQVVNADITIICESPKVGPHREAMQKRVAELLGIAPDRVNIKATTTEQLGFTGRGEGLAAQAIANVRLRNG